MKEFCEVIFMIKLYIFAILSLFFINHIFSQGSQAVVLISGKVVNERNMQPVESRIVWELLPEGKEVGIARSDPSNGNYKIILPHGKKYGYMALAEGYYSVTKFLDLTNLEQYTEIDEQNLYLAPVMESQVARLNNVFFKDQSDEFMPESVCELDRFVSFLKINKKIKCEIAAHTDNIGDDAKNMELSQRRAQKVVDYCISKGIKSERLVAKGYGETQPVAFNGDEDGRAMNRRVEFKVLSIK
ncbi:MAG TPA: OmpA family protein [Bacteroidales bacterium]|nr:OmpA family protein [Bacteroidales bacterium]HOU98037.1 OmpA family protein [Bacteroidales bacterium]